MPATTFFVPILSGKTEEFKQIVAEVTGPRKGEYEDMLRRSGMTRFFYTLQSTPMGDFVALYVEADDPNAVTSRIINSDHPFDRWFKETVLNGMHGIDRPQLLALPSASSWR